MYILKQNFNNSEPRALPPSLVYGRAPLMMCMSNMTHYAYTMLLQTNGNTAFQVKGLFWSLKPIFKSYSTFRFEVPFSSLSQIFES